MNLALSSESKEYEGKKYTASLIQLTNAVIAIFWVGDEPRLGSLSATMPGTVSTELLGDRDQLLGRTLGGYLSQRFGKIALVSVNIPQASSEEVGKILMELARKLSEGNDK